MEEKKDKRFFRAKLNIITSLFRQGVTLLCGIIIPKLLISTFGSEAYGATTSISQFLAYITLLEGGIGGVARAALYKPLADNDYRTVSAIVCEIKRFFRIVGLIFLVYTVILACGFQSLSHIQCFDWLTTFWLVIVISISTFAQYFIGISYAVLLQAGQLSYITDAINIISTVLNTVLTVALVYNHSTLIVVKLVSSCVFVLKPVFMWLFAQKRFHIQPVKKTQQVYLTQKWDGLAQHIAFFLHTNTDVAVLTIFSNLTVVAVYSVYNMIVSQIQNFSSSFASGMEALFGDMLAKDEMQQLHGTFDYFETMISFIATTIFSVTMVMIIPFVKIYTADVQDANYIEPLFAVFLVLASVMTCLRAPYHNMTIAAGHFKQTRAAAYGEAAINITLSIVLVTKFGLIGVAIGTLAATTFRMVYYAIYLTNHIFNRPISKFLKREILNFVVIAIICLVGHVIKSIWTFNNYLSWAVCATLVSFVAVVVASVVNFIFYKEHFLETVRKMVPKH